MKKDFVLKEMPDHSHYAACAARKADIQEFSRNVFVYTLGTSLIFLFLTFIGVDIAVISWIPSYFGDSTEIGHLFAQTFELVLFTGISFIAYGSRKYLHIIIFFVYVVYIVGAIFDGSAIDIITFIVGVIGVVLMRDCFTYVNDYRLLMSAEGWPHFDVHLTEYDEHPSYTSRYAAELLKAPADKVEILAHLMSRPEGTKSASPRPAPMRAKPAAPATDEMPEMEEMPSIMTISSEAPEAPDVEFFEPDSGLPEDTYEN